MSFFLLGLLAVLVGLTIGASGVGGVLLIPLLTYFGGLSIHAAMATALFSFFFTGVAATLIFQRHGSFDWSVALPVCAGSLITGYAGAWVNSLSSPTALYLILGLIVISSSLYSMRPPRRSCLIDGMSARGRRLLLFVTGLGVGFLCGLTGIGGGLVSLPVMLIMGFNPLASIATGQVLQSIVAVSGSVSNISNGFVDFGLVWWVTALELVGVFWGVSLAHKLPVPTLKKLAAWLCLLIGVYMLAQAFI